MENKIIKRNFHDQQFLSDLSKKLYEHCKIGQKCDFKLKTEDGGELKVHKIVLEAASPFFEKMLSSESEFNDNHADSVLIRRCSSSALEKIIEFMYTGKVEITSIIARELLDTALFLGLMSLVDMCTEILVETVNSDNCFGLLAYSETYFTSEALAEKCMKTICENFETLKDSPEFFEMSIDAMKKLCSCDRNLCNDEQLYLAIVDWIKFDKENREKFLCVLLDKIQFEEISLKFGITNILKDSTLWDNRVYISKVIDIIQKNWTRQLEKDENQKIIMTRSELINLYAVIGDEVHLFDPGLKPFTKRITKINTTSAEGCGYSTFGDKNLFVCGGEVNGIGNTKSCNYYSFREDSWKSLPSMEVAREYHRAIKLNNKIYVCGGVNEKTVEIFDINETKWSRGPSLDQDRAFIGLCLHNQNIYAAHLQSLQFLDTRSDKWTKLPSLFKTTSEMYSAINYKDLIYGIAGDGIFTFDIRGNKWLENVTSFKENYVSNSPEACMINNEIYVFQRLDYYNTYMLHSFDASNLSLRDFQSIELSLNNSYCSGLFSL